MSHGFYIWLVRFLAAASLCYGLSNTASAQTAVSCFEIPGETPRLIECPLQVGEPEKATGVNVLVSNTGVSVPAQLVERPASSESASWLFLVDKSNSRRAAAVRASGELIKRVTQNARINDRFAIATLAEDYEVIARFGSTPAQLSTAADALVAEGAATELYRIALEGIKDLAKETSDRKSLVLISDGKAEDQAFTSNQVIEAARAAGIVIYGIGIPERASDTPSLQSLRVLAEGTNGPFVRAEARTKAFPNSFVDNFSGPLLGGGRMIVFEAPSSTTAYTIDVALESGLTARLAATQSTSTSDTVGTQTTRPTVNGQENDNTFLSYVTTAQSLFWEYWNDSIYRWVIVAAGGLFALALAWLIFGKKKKKDDSEITSTSDFAYDSPEVGFGDANSGATGPVTSRFVSTPKAELDVKTGGAPTVDFETAKFSGDDELPTQKVGSEIFATFEVTDGERTYDYQVRSTSMRIGRHNDNDLTLKDETVHRSHAVMHRTPDKGLVITDLATTNGIVVNGVLVEKADITVGDIIELGEVKIVVKNIA